MRHRKSIKKLGRTASHRKALLANLARELITHKRITTTLAKAKEAGKFTERMITFAKRGDVHARRQVLKYMRHKDIVNMLFEEVAPVYKDREGGYTRVLKLGRRQGDAAKTALLELVDSEKIGTISASEVKTETPKPKKEKVEEVKAEAVEEVKVEEVVAEQPAAEAPEETKSEDSTDKKE
ncbi:MAG: 50S ribosomal protein L17 [Calditrichaeota bacterium]|nr:MAG: 50S ribosomal protein L17 [Calditrichota bacterium]